jgi:L,D-peptidoglycan transpeptidase YkuD (ErfK/YbiS/YcfS/YnhG family)
LLKLILFPRKIYWLAASFILIACQDPPTVTFENAKAALNLAADAGALRYAESHYRLAEKYFHDGWMEMAHQKGRLAPFRNYKDADSLLVLATEVAGKARQMSLEAISNLDSLARASRGNLAQELGAWRESLDGSLENFQAEKYYSAAGFALDQADALIRQTEYQEALQTVQRGKEELRRLENSVAEYINDEAQKIGVWRAWVHGTLQKSKAGGTYAIIIDKSAHKAYLIKSGKLVHSYKCELGYNSAHQKLFAGDGATPEGTYRVTKVNHNSKFHKALMINYPNQTDLRRLGENKSKGIISRYARAGALIEIHGEGGKNRDWTDGCVALENNDIDHLIKYAAVGTPVTIVRKSDRWP